MRLLIYLIFLVPFLGISQAEEVDPETGDLLLESLMLTPHPEKVPQFRQALAAHNREYHSEDPFGARVYYISSGPNTGKYMQVTGPLSWADRDAASEWLQEREEAWIKKVLPYTLPEADLTYWKTHPALSSFPEEFTIHKLLVDLYDVEEYRDDRMIKLLETSGRLAMEKFPDITYGIYTNMFPSTREGKDMAMVFFFEDYEWLAKDLKFEEAFEAFYGAGSFRDYLQEWRQVTRGKSSEIWILQPDISGSAAGITPGKRN